MSATLLKDATSHTSNYQDLFRVGLKLALFGLSLVVYFVSMAFLKLACSLVSLGKSSHIPNVWTQLCAKWCLLFMGVQVSREGNILDGASLMVGNHLSYIDALVLASLTPCHFVTSVEIKNTPVLGQICQLANCLFVERRSRKFLSNEVAEISSALKEGRRVVIFPEGTSTNGDEVLRFKRPLFQAALDAGVSVQTFCLNYSGFDERDNICWYADMAFFPHLKRFFRQASTRVEVVMGPSAVKGEDPAELAQNSREQVVENFKSLYRDESSEPQNSTLGSSYTYIGNET